MSIVGIVLSLILLMTFAYRGANIILLAPVMSVVAVLFDADARVLASYTQIFMPALGRFIANYFPLFALGAMFGRLLEATGSTSIIATRISEMLGPRRAIWAVVLSCAVLTYAGVSVFVVVFAVFPISSELFRKAQIPKRLLPGTIALGSFTFAMTTLPGSLQIHNLIPMTYFGTTAFASPGLGLIAAACMLSLGMAWLTHRAAVAARAGEGYSSVVEDPVEVPIRRAGPEVSFPMAVAPIVVVTAMNLFLSQFVFAEGRYDYLAEVKYGGTSIAQVRGVWSTIVALVIALGVTSWISPLRWRQTYQALAEGVGLSLTPLLNTASEVGYGATIASLSGFSAIKASVLTLTASNPLISSAASINLLAGVTGSASGGLTIALESIGGVLRERADAANISPELLHRVAAMSSCGLDTLPHNGVVITLLLICGLSHRQAYLDVFVTSVLVPVTATALVLVLASAL